MRARRTLRDMAGDPQLIPGVFNYCDRWCERCPLTSRCLVYATEQQDGTEDPASRDIHNRAFWNRLEEMFREAKEMLEEMMREHGIEIDPADLTAEVEEEKRAQEEAWEHPCAVAGTAYSRSVRTWLETAGPLFQERGAALESQQRLGLPGADAEGQALRLQEAMEIVRWYQHQIAVKIMRALHSARHEDATEGGPEQSDADGSAKVALIGIDRSLAAWAELLRQLPDAEDHILPLLADLSRLRRELEATFPRARTFIRPGFDTGETTT